jgi:mycoredoxin
VEQLRGLLAFPQASYLDRQETLMSSFTLYSTPWCGYCHRLKAGLDREGIAYDEVDIEADPAAAELVMSVNGGNATVPTLVFADGSSLTNPSLAEVKAKLATPTAADA